ncbi:hypothetical protein [Niveibacterium sp. COAC-50]|uniref:hypothetical protein n=1 Tax=Niveibacterium sp. COAC-50 TaxID=2729384 RepID=UPI00155353C7|nr:hypothetical protein [Niveibacterium sp. COAC-50]
MSKHGNNRRRLSELPDTMTPAQRASVAKMIADYEKNEAARTIAVGVGAQGRSNNDPTRLSPEEIESLRQGARDALASLRANRLPDLAGTPPAINKRRISQLPDATTPEERAAVNKMIADWEAKEALRKWEGDHPPVGGSEVQPDTTMLGGV